MADRRRHPRPLDPNAAARARGPGWLDAFDDLFDGIHQAILEQQVTLLGWLAADPSLLGAFEGAGGDRNLFLEPGDMRGDLDAIYVAIATAREAGRDRVFAAQCARRALRHVGLWSDDDHWGGGSQWTPRRLALLFDATFRSAAHVERHTRKLIDLRRRAREASAHLSQVLLALEESPDNVVDRAHRLTDARLVSRREQSVAVHFRRRTGSGVCHTKLI